MEHVRGVETESPSVFFVGVGRYLCPPMPSSSSKTVRKGDTTLVPLRDELKRVLKMPKPEFVEYMVKNSTKKELKELMIQLEESELNIRPLPAGNKSILPALLKNKTKVEIAIAVYALLQRKPYWSDYIIMVSYGLANLGFVGYTASRPFASIPTKGAALFCFINAIISFVFASYENTPNKIIKGWRTTFKRHIHKKLKREAAGRTYNRAWMQDLRNYFQTSKPTKSTSQTKKAARK